MSLNSLNDDLIRTILSFVRIKIEEELFENFLFATQYLSCFHYAEAPRERFLQNLKINPKYLQKLLLENNNKNFIRILKADISADEDLSQLRCIHTLEITKREFHEFALQNIQEIHTLKVQVKTVHPKFLSKIKKVHTLDITIDNFPNGLIFPKVIHTMKLKKVYNC